jgi:Cellulase M and related proteins
MKDLLLNLLSAKDTAKFVVEELKKYTQSINFDALGNIKASFGGNAKVLLDAHLDKVGLIVTAVEGDFVRVAQVGGIDPHVLPSTKFVIHTSEGNVPAVGISIAPHLKKDEDRKLKIEEFYLCADTSKVAVGNRISYAAKPELFGDGQIVSPALDDLAGVAIILFVLSKIENSTGLEVVFSMGEELGLRGASAQSFKSDAGIAVAIDASFGNAPGVPERKFGKVGSGVMIGVSPSLNAELSDSLKGLAKSNKIAYQLEVMAGMTGTNSDVLDLPARKTALLSVPIRNMHTPSETMMIKDAEAAAELLAAFVESVL